MGNFYVEEFKKNKINTHFFFSETGTGHATALISTDSERTFGTYLGAALELTAEEMTHEIFQDYGILHIEGYLVQNHALIEAAMKIAKENELIVSIDMASFNIVEANLDFLHRIIGNYVDIVFANEEEALALTGKNPEEALSEIAGMCSIAVVKLGAKGSLVQTGNRVIRIEGVPAKSIDTTGAGDIYAAGFLYALSENLGLEIAGEIGSLLAAKVVEVMGAKIPEETWEILLRKIELIKRKELEQ
jgi:sugar/nucleoside kinase (ribokinase family)